MTSVFDFALLLIAAHFVISGRVQKLRKTSPFIKDKSRGYFATDYELLRATEGTTSHRAQWRVFHAPIGFDPDKVDNVIKAATVLHNFLRHRNPGRYND